MPESIQLCFELSIHFPVFFSRELFLVAVTAVSLYRQMYGKFKTRLDTFWHSYIPPIFSYTPFPSAKSFQFMNFSEVMFYENYLTRDFHTNTVISSLFDYSSIWRRKP